MRPYGVGILPNSRVYFYTPKENDPELFLYPLCVGLYECDGNYIVDRQNYDSFLLMYLISGTAYVTVNGQTRELKKDDCAILDCYRPHIYGSSSGCKLLWIHFDGANARKYYNYIVTLQKGNVLKAADRSQAYRYMSRLYSALANRLPIESAHISKYLLSGLTEFMYHGEDSTGDTVSDLEKARIYITENLDKDIPLEDIAAQAKLSVYYFTRCFKKSFGYTPHEYLIKTRLNTACFYLVSSSMFVKEIAYRCGFKNESNFCTCFKKNIGMTPQEYRDSRAASLPDDE